MSSAAKTGAKKGAADQPVTMKTTTLSADQSVEEAFGTVMRSNLQTMIQWEPVAALGEDIEGVHQMRVVLRRMRSAMSVFRKAVPRSVVEHWGEEMRWAADVLGPARDRDVFIDEALKPMAGLIPLADGEQRMGEVAAAFRDEAYVAVREMLKGERYLRFKQEFEEWVNRSGWREGELTELERSRLTEKVTPFAAKVLTRRMTQTLADGVRIMELPPEERHMLRIDCKKVRYATEFFSVLFDRQGMARFVLVLKELQGLLGVLNDVAVMPGLLAQLTERDGRPEVLQYAGAIIGWRSLQAVAVHEQLGGKWKMFAAVPQPWKKPRTRGRK